MTTQKADDAAVPGRELQISNVGKIPASVLKLIQTTPKKEWSKIRAYQIGSEEEGELIEMLPAVNRVMTVCIPKLVGRVRKHEIKGDQLDQAYQQLHDAIHGLRQTLYALIILAGFKDPEKKESKPEESAPETAVPVEDLEPATKVAPAAPDRLALAGGPRKL
jgi:hypothetical protein